MPAPASGQWLTILALSLSMPLSYLRGNRLIVTLPRARTCILYS
jgi:hypothetical protein